MKRITDQRDGMVGMCRPSRWNGRQTPTIALDGRLQNISVLDVLYVTETTDQTLDVLISDTPTVGSVDPKARDERHECGVIRVRAATC